MKADQLRFIYECLSGENGLLYLDTETHDFLENIKNADENEIVEEALIDCEICNKNFY